MAEIIKSSDTERIPSSTTLQHAVKISIQQDKPILLDYWVDSVSKTAFIGIKPTGEKLLVKSSDEYTSPICNVFLVDTEYIIVTENSIYIISSTTPAKKLST
jgi:hypothetical protein